MTTRSTIRTASLTHPGRVRANNEDAVGIDLALGALVLADGMGGHNAGEVASHLAVQIMLESLKASPSTTAIAPGERLVQATIRAHEAVWHRAQTDPLCKDMGTTVVAALLQGAKLFIAYAGDSRLYRLRNERLEALTRDHSLLEQLIQKGHYSREEALQWVRKNIVTRALGAEATIEVDLIEQDLQVGDVLLLCSDGLNDMISDEMISALMNQHADNPDAAAQQLLNAALEHGGRDNISVIVARVETIGEVSTAWYRRLLPH